MWVQISFIFCILGSLGYILKSVIAESYGNSIPRVLTSVHFVFYKGCTSGIATSSECRSLYPFFVHSLHWLFFFTSVSLSMWGNILLFSCSLCCFYYYMLFHDICIVGHFYHTERLLLCVFAMLRWEKSVFYWLVISRIWASIHIVSSKKEVTCI